jgi:two-component system sensor histidine kinase DegS
MNNDESSIDSGNLGLKKQLDLILLQLINTMEQSRGDIFNILEKSRQQSLRLQAELEELRLKAERVEELTRQVDEFQAISQKAESFLDSTSLALKILQGNIDNISVTIMDSCRNKQMGVRIIESQEAERRKIARDLHDGPAQNLAGMMIRLDLLQSLGKTHINRILEEMENIKQMLAASLSEIRRIMFDLRPAQLQADDFCAALSDFFKDYEAKYDMHIHFVVGGEKKKYDKSLQIALFRVVQEAISNVRKHSGTNQALVKLEDKGQSLALVIEDEGCGFDLEQTAAKSESYGIIGMKERVELLGGEVKIISVPAKGTQVIITVPLEGDVKNGQNKGCHSG